MLRCPECNASLVEELQLGIHIDRCSKCHGIWFDSGELDSYRQRISGLAAAPKIPFITDVDQPKSACPRCQKSELVVGDLGEHALRKCGSCYGVFVPSSTIDQFRPNSARQIAGEIALEVTAHGGVEILGDVLAWVIEGMFNSL